MGKNNKGSNAKRTPSNRITTHQIYKKQSWEHQHRKLDTEFNKGVFTMKTVSVQLEIDRSNICRYCAKRRKQNRIYLVKFGICPVTNSGGVGFYTTNFELFNANKIGNHGK